MDFSTLIIPAAFLILVSMLLWFIIDIKRMWWTKLLLILVVPYSSIIIWNSIDSYRGWPAQERPPEESMFVWSYVVEPFPGSEKTGMIYIWLLPYKKTDSQNFISRIFEYRAGPNEPRAYKFPYSRNLHEQIDTANGKVESGHVIIANIKESVGGQGEEYEFQFYDLPPPKFSDKN